MTHKSQFEGFGESPDIYMEQVLVPMRRYRLAYFCSLEPRIFRIIEFSLTCNLPHCFFVAAQVWAPNVKDRNDSAFLQFIYVTNYLNFR